jgi:mannobiose 2-epimerase
VDRTLEILDDPELKKRLAEITRELTKQTYKVAFDGNSFANECEKGVVDTNRVWWVQAEAVVGFINGWQATGKSEYMEAAMSIWKFIKDKIIDKRDGSEWFWVVDKDGKPIGGEPIVEPWKCPYHNGRMCFEVMDRLKNDNRG